MKMKKIFKSLVSILLAMSMFFACTGCTKNSASTSQVIHIGTSFPMTGSVAADGTLIVNAIQLAVDQVNESGGVKGKKVVLDQEDDEASPTSAASIANKFAENKDILSVITSYNSSCCLAQVPIYEDAKLPAISPVATSPQLTGISNYFYRTAPSDAYVGSVGADLCAKLGWKNVALLYENDDYGLGISKEFQNQATKDGIKIGTTQNFVYGQTVDFGTILTAAADAKVDGIFVCGLVTETGLICEQKASYGCANIPVAGANGLYSPAIFNYGKAVDGIYVIGEFTADDPSDTVQSFIKAYREKYNTDPGNWAALAYDATMVALNAMKNVDGELTREKINEQINKISYTGVAGTYKFTKGDCAKQEYFFKAVDGKFQIYN